LLATESKMQSASDTSSRPTSGSWIGGTNIPCLSCVCVIGPCGPITFCIWSWIFCFPVKLEINYMSEYLKWNLYQLWLRVAPVRLDQRLPRQSLTMETPSILPAFRNKEFSISKGSGKRFFALWVLDADCISCFHIFFLTRKHYFS
jgi:hypothetical protein